MLGSVRIGDNSGDTSFRAPSALRVIFPRAVLRNVLLGLLAKWRWILSPSGVHGGNVEL
jgi:hypothetical protein